MRKLLRRLIPSRNDSSGESRFKLPFFIDLILVGIFVGFVFSQLEPKWLLTNTTTAGGDMGAHVWLPQFIRDHLFPHGRITGWTPDWYAGFPAATFYFPLPALAIALLSYVIPYGVAFKLVTVSGVVGFPLAVYIFGRAARLPFPVPTCLAAFSLLFLFDTGYSIFGGNIASTLAGEYSFSIGLCFSMIFLGLVAGGLDTGKRRWLATLFFAATILSHILPTLFAIVGGTVFVLMRLVVGVPRDQPLSGADDTQVIEKSSFGVRLQYALGVVLTSAAFALSWFVVSNGAEITTIDRVLQIAFLLLGLVGVALIFMAIRSTPATSPRSGRISALRWAFPVGLFGCLISGFWAIPFILRSNYMNDMGWEKIGTGELSGITLYGEQIRSYSEALFPRDLWSLLIIAYASAVFALALRRRIGTWFVLMGVICAVGFILMPQGRLWNARLLPFWYLSVYLLVGLLVAELGWSVYELLRNDRTSAVLRRLARMLRVAAPIGAATVSLVIVMHSLPAPSWWSETTYFPWHDPKKPGLSFVPGWARWNYTGYEGKENGVYLKPGYHEYQALLETMNDIGRTNGCGRAMWEYESSLDRFGTPMALMLLPMHTDGCIGSMEGLFFESSATVPYHFLNQSVLSSGPSRAMRNLPYGELDVLDGVSRLQMMGVRYYMAVTPEAQQQAALDQRLTLLSTIPASNERTWNVYKVADSQLVAPLRYLPAVMTSPGSIEPIVSKEDSPGSAREVWLENAVTWYEDPAVHDVVLAASGPSDWPRVANAGEQAPRVPVAPANVTFISTGDDRINFTVDKVGSPVVVRASYFPNWQVTGAEGPYRITPNLMVVVPTSNNVSLHYGHTPVDWYGIVFTIIGLAGVGWLWRRDRFSDPVPLGPPIKETQLGEEAEAQDGTTADSDSGDSEVAMVDVERDSGPDKGSLDANPNGQLDRPDQEISDDEPSDDASSGRDNSDDPKPPE